MSFGLSDEEARVLELERKILRLPNLEPRIAALEQCTWQMWENIIAVSSSPPPMTIYSGQIRSCGTFGLPGATVQIQLHSSGALLDTQTTDAAGDYAGMVTLPGSSAQVDLVVTSNTVRLNNVTNTYTWNAGANVVPTIALSAATGYVCTSLCPLPLKTTLQLTDSYMQGLEDGDTFPVAATWNPSVGAWQYEFHFVDTPGCPGQGCNPINHVPITYNIFAPPSTQAPSGAFQVNVVYPIAGGGSLCPVRTNVVTGTCTTIQSSLTCSPLNLTLSMTHDNFWKNLYCSNSSTITVTE
jgi:hypothetical protein